MLIFLKYLPSQGYTKNINYLDLFYTILHSESEIKKDDYKSEFWKLVVPNNDNFSQETKLGTF